MIYRFANCLLDSERRELRVDGAPVHVEPQVFDVLLLLLENRDRVVGRDELIDAVWGGRIVSEATLGARIWSARHAVGDTGNTQAVIRTLPRRGFRLVAPVALDEAERDSPAGPDEGGERVSRPTDDGATEAGAAAIVPATIGPATPGPGTVRSRPASPLRRAMAAVGALLLLLAIGTVGSGHLWGPRIERASPERMAYPLPDKPSIAVLPFANLTSDAARDFMGEGLTESLVNGLARNPFIFVVAHSATADHADGSAVARRVAEAFGVRYVIEGSVRRSDGTVRVTTELVDALGGSVVWSERYRRPARTFLALSEEITAEIARTLDVRLTYGTEPSSGGTLSLDAWAAYVQGREAYLEFSETGNARAREHYRRALAFDPDYAEAIVALAKTHFVELARLPAEEWGGVLARIEDLRRQAERIAPRMPQLFDLRSLLALTKGDYDLALKEAEAMAALYPNGPESHYVLGRMLFFAGKYRRAIEALETAERINPHNRASYMSHLAFSHLALGRLDTATAIIETIVADWPDYSAGRAYLAIVYQLAGRGPEAREQAELLPRVAPLMTMRTVMLRFSPLRDRGFADRIMEAARAAGIPGTS